MASTEAFTAAGNRAPKLGTDLKSRIQSRLDALGISEREASRRAGFGLSYVWDLLNDRAKSPSSGRLIKLAKSLECDVDFLLGTQDSPRLIKEERSFAPGAAFSGNSQRLIDLYSSPSVSGEPFAPLSVAAVDRVPVIPPLMHVRDAYAYSISAPNMEPRYFVGEVVYLHPGITARVGDFIFVKLKNGRAGVCRLAEVGDDYFVFTHLNYKPDCRPKKDEVEFIHRIVGSAG